MSDPRKGIALYRQDNRRLIIFDATLESTHTRLADITTYPVEDQDYGTDHRRTRPQSWRFVAVFMQEDQDRRIVEGRSHLVGKDPATFPPGLALNETRALDELEKLKEVHNSSEKVTVYSDTEIIDDAMLESLDSRLLGGGAAVEVTGVFREVRFAFAERQPIPTLPLRDRKKKKKKGTVSGKNVGPEEPKSLGVLLGLKRAAQ